MKKEALNWRLGYSNDESTLPQEYIPANVPGAVQLDYGNAHGYPLYYQGLNFKNYKWMEDVYWFYETPLSFSADDTDKVYLCFKGIDYKYRISIDGEILKEDEGMFSRLKFDITRFAGKGHTLTVMLYPVPKAELSGYRWRERNQARYSTKSCACYGWDWHPRLVTSGIWDEAYLLFDTVCAIENVEASYALSEDLKNANLNVEIRTASDGEVTIKLTDPDGATAFEKTVFAENSEASVKATVRDAKLWYPVGYGKQNMYLLTVSSADGSSVITRKIGFRRSQLLMNEGTWKEPFGYPKSRSAAPITVTINGQRLFAKGSNWINCEIFPSMMTEEHYRTLLNYCVECNMNILRVWGGGFINKDSFYDICDELGIMIWQEFPLACNEYPDDDGYLRTLENESTAIVRRLRTHPCLAFWCGGNELFNSWSRMTEQHHALRLLDKVTYTEDRYTPFIMTAPLNGMGHGPYRNVDPETGEEAMRMFAKSHYTAYSEFGNFITPSMEELKLFMTEEEIRTVKPQDELWIAHQNYSEWRPGSDIFVDVDYFFGGYENLEDFVNKERFIGAMCSKSIFEEIRKQWPYCSMALNWCFNDAWPMIMTKAIVSYHETLTPLFYAAKEALRPQLASVRVPYELWHNGDEFTAEIFMMNDTLETLKAGKVYASIDDGTGIRTLGSFVFGDVAPQSNIRLGSVSYMISEAAKPGLLRVWLKVDGHPEMDSHYEYVIRARTPELVPGTFLNVN